MVKFSLIFGFHPLTDFYSPKKMLEETVAAEKFGFREIYYADHFHPWTLAEGTTFAWTLIASAAERTRKVRIGTAVTCPMIRYNPAIVAQAFATLAATYEGRIFLGVGTGEALNEVPVGYDWPNGKVRLEMLEEAVEIIRMLWRNDYVSFKGKHYVIKNANLFTKPPKPIPLFISALGPKTAYLAGKQGDGWITLNLPEDRIKHVLLPKFEQGVRDRSANDASQGVRKIAEIIVSYDDDLDRAIEACRPFAGTFSPKVFENEIIDPRDIKTMGDYVDKKTIEEKMIATNGIERIISAIEKFESLGFDCVEIASLSPNQTRFMDVFRDKISPQFNRNVV
jgi:G6PDH family F420-dependent oxidoreductase